MYIGIRVQINWVKLSGIEEVYAYVVQIGVLGRQYLTAVNFSSSSSPLPCLFVLVPGSSKISS